MSTLKKLFILALSLGVTFAMIACDDDTECDGGNCDGGAAGAGNEGGEAGTTPTESYQYIMIVDNSADENSAGTPGVDICGIYADCAGTTVSAGNATLATDDANICEAGASGCSADRGDANAAEDEGAACAGASNPSDYVSLGMGGTLTVDFGQDLQGCTVHVIELDGGDSEGASVLVCSDPADDTTCVDLGTFETQGGGPGDGADNTFSVDL